MMLKTLVNKSLDLKSASDSNIINRVCGNNKVDKFKKRFSRKNQNQK